MGGTLDNSVDAGSDQGAVASDSLSIPIVQEAWLTVIKHVVNANGGTAAASDFTMIVWGTNVSPQAVFPGSESGTTVTLDAGFYSVMESSMAGYRASSSTGCSGTIAYGESRTCIITNSDQFSALTIVKHVINNNGGTAVAGDFTMTVNGRVLTAASFPGSDLGTTVIMGPATTQSANPARRATVKATPLTAPALWGTVSGASAP